MKLFYVSLGCPKNVVDLEMILGGLGPPFEIVGEPDTAEIALVNTCAFITSAKQEAIETILQLAALKEHRPDLKLLVCGCLPQRYHQEIVHLLPEVDGFFFNRDARVTAAEIRAFFGASGQPEQPRYRLTPKHYAFLRIAEGCDNRCSYCAIPLIKGSYQSRSLQEIQQEAEILADAGVKEVMVVAQDTTLYGHDLGTSTRLHHVLASLQQTKGIHWIRLLYTHPAHWSDQLIDAVAGLDKVVPYVDLPIQHISDHLLQAMKRRVNRHQIELLIEKLRRSIPNLALRTSLIVGFPGESAQDFAELCDFVRQVRFERLGTFSYSQEEGTPAALLPDDVSEEEKQSRLHEIMEIQAGISLQQNQDLIGQRLQVLVDRPGEDAGTSLARTVWDAPDIDNDVIIDQDLAPGTLTSIWCTGADIYDLFGHPAEAEE